MQKVVVSPDFYYFISGSKPKLLIHSGTHGDEFEVIDHVQAAIQKYEKDLPPFIFVPRVSPTAVKNKSRVNTFGHDLNREFFTDSDDFEVQSNIKIIKDMKFDIFVSFHEDWEYPDYYVYDVGYSNRNDRLVLDHNQKLKEKGIGLYTGVDDPEDPDLGFEIVDGYIKMVHPANYHDDGTISAWALNRQIAENYYCLEIPGGAERQIKKFIVDSFFEDVIIKSIK
ncbi:MAG: hypothetical protein UW68_C0007G0028 [Candidatus Collierbacteria bacterium GW2011_GWB1_44_6]|uniref:Succinylglutamate desuccinylase/Aspartoacylase catalytic domain-containing protein n=1 Tax=Candidatus Collierbacteria bacterium GW2011_GWB1_44_6 TaxID=1618384 RepID=A0A0G1JQ87_9BACT|nr:MAG: hypothetical protein UW68_C0007G0028 [Candidatus Collierbacteria bacterium GW2011_GWB1_44_6]KKT82806.1 MAG: hypothetical protein UW80_C0031G0007 [Microgenomates group bacterium GW2011_GWC1_44_9]